MIVELGLDGQSSLVEIPGLSVSSIWSLDHHVSVVNEVKVSVSLQSRNDIEWSFDIHTIFFIELSFSWFTLPLISVDDVPLLMHLLILVLVTLDMSSF